MLIVDAGPLVAAADADDRDHDRCVELLSTARGPLLVPALVVAEVAYLLGTRIGPQSELAFAQSIADGELVAEPVLDPEWPRVAELTERYVDLPLGIVDAALVVLAERHRAETIASLDHRQFTTVRPAHVKSFRLVP